MFKRGLSRLLALCLCLAMLTGASAEEIASEALESAPVEQEEFALEVPEDLPESLPVPGDVPMAAAPEAAEEPAPAEEPVDEPAAPGDWVITETLAVGSDTWSDVNLTRASGFTGSFARVTGTLILNNVRVDGVPASQADLPACFELEEGAAIAAADGAPLVLSLSAACLNKGDKRTLALAWNGEAIKAKKARWSSSDKKVVSVSRGAIKAKKAGSAVITATYEGVTAACRVLVVNHQPVKSVKLSKSKLTLALNGAVQLTAAIKPADAWNQALTWTSSDPRVASVDENGWVAGLSGGKATITATAASGKKASCKVTVQEIKPTGVDFARLYLTLRPGERIANPVGLRPESVSNPAVRFASSDPAVATVDENGTITAVGVGTATVTVACAAAPGVTNTCKVCVLEEGAARLAGVIIGINPGHQRKTITQKYPLAPGSREKAYGCKTGACGKFTRVPEYETVLQIGLKLKRILEAEGATVVITRTSNDVSLTNIERARILNDAGVDVALQLHCNSVSNASKEGNSGYIRTTGDWVEESAAFADCITRQISAHTGAVNKGVKVYNKYMSLNWTTTPSVLLEMGYISNQKEDELLATDEYREKVAQGIAEGLCEYFGR